MNFPTNIYLFVNDCYSKVVDSQNIDIKESFLKHVDNNEENANKYASCLAKVEEALKEDLKFFFNSLKRAADLSIQNRKMRTTVSRNISAFHLSSSS